MSNPMKSDHDQLIHLLDIFSLKSGKEFTLASGQKSNVYVDVKKTALHSSGTKLLSKMLFDKMTKEFDHVDAVAGVVLGGCHLASIVAMSSPYGMDVIFVRKENKDHGTKTLVERPFMMEGDYVVILEDVVTTGTSALAAAHLLQKEGFEVKGILAVVDRRVEKSRFLSDSSGSFPFVALVNFEELHL